MGGCGARCPKILARAATVAGRCWRRVLAVLAPIALCPLLILYDSKETKCAYAILLMAVYWMFELVHLSVTSLLPVFLFPILGILDTASTTAPYMKDVNMMYLAGMIMAAAVEHCNLHYRIALRILLLIGTKTIWLLLGFMTTAMFLSMWLSNMATTLMVLPIVDAVVDEICKKTAEGNLKYGTQDTAYTNDGFREENGQGSVESLELQTKGSEQRWEASTSRFRHAMLLGIAYAANIGGTGSVIGTAPNLIIMGLVEELYPSSATLSFATWMIYNVPPMILCVICAWLYLYFHFIPKRFRSGQLNHEAVGQAIRKRYDDLGPISFHEVAVLAIFIVTVLLWFFRDPYVVTGWASFFPLGKNIKDATPAMLMVLLLFLIPAKPVADPGGSSLLGWQVVQKKIPWGVLLLMGGSFSMAEASKSSGLSVMIGQYLTRLDFLHPILLVTVLCIFTCVVTEIASNTATASVLLPITSYLAQALRIHPLYLMIPVTVSASFAFMLPVATPPNAMVYEHGNMKLSDMVKTGFVMNVACILIEVLAINTLGEWAFNLSQFPAWAEPANSTRSTAPMDVTQATTAGVL